MNYGKLNGLLAAIFCISFLSCNQSTTGEVSALGKGSKVVQGDEVALKLEKYLSENGSEDLIPKVLKNRQDILAAGLSMEGNSFALDGASNSQNPFMDYAVCAKLQIALIWKAGGAKCMSLVNGKTLTLGYTGVGLSAGIDAAAGLIVYKNFPNLNEQNYGGFALSPQLTKTIAKIVEEGGKQVVKTVLKILPVGVDFFWASSEQYGTVLFGGIKIGASLDISTLELTIKKSLN